MIRIINDIHLGASRKAGTTPASQVALKAFVREQFSDLVCSATGHLVINGDLFDGFTVEAVEVIHAFTVLLPWLGGVNNRLTHRFLLWAYFRSSSRLRHWLKYRCPFRHLATPHSP